MLRKLDDNPSTSAGWGNLDGDGYLRWAITATPGLHHLPTDCTHDENATSAVALAPPISTTTRRRSPTSRNRPAHGRGIGVLFVDVNNDGRPDHGQ